MIKQHTIEEMVDDLNNWADVFLPNSTLRLDKESILITFNGNPNYAFERVCEFKNKLEKLFDEECLKSKK